MGNPPILPHIFSIETLDFIGNRRESAESQLPPWLFELKRLLSETSVAWLDGSGGNCATRRRFP